MSKSVDLWLDLKSPYSFLAKDPAYALERELGVTLRLRPYALDILARLQRGRSQGPNAACVA
jgi:2-hydroxychromene-2-carboxylate isomerase